MTRKSLREDTIWVENETPTSDNKSYFEKFAHPDYFMKRHPANIMLLLFILIFIGLALILSPYLIALFNSGKTTQSTQKVQTNTTPTPPTTDETANWKTYETNTFSIKYPTDWVVNVDPTTQKAEMQDSASSSAKRISITTINSTQTPKEYADLQSKVDRRSLVVSGLTAEIYKETGAGYGIVVTNGKQLVVASIPTSGLSIDPTILQILSTFKFTN